MIVVGGSGGASGTPADGSVTDAKVAADAAIAESKLALESDAAAGTASRRSLGSGSTQAAAGNHTHSGYAATAHNHATGDVTSGTFALARIPTGTSSSAVALGNHNHDGAYAAVPPATQAISYAASITPDASVATSGAVTATGALTVNPPTGGRVGGGYVLAVTASSANRAVTLSGFTLAGATSPYTVLSGKTVLFGLLRLAGGWWVVAQTPGP